MNYQRHNNFQKTMFDPLQSFLSKNKGKELCVVFDLGSKASRYIIGSKLKHQDLSSWDPFTYFFSETDKNELLSYFNFFNNKIDLKALERTIEFINITRKKFDSFVSEQNYILVGTEVFRIASNQMEVQNLIKE